MKIKFDCWKKTSCTAVQRQKDVKNVSEMYKTIFAGDDLCQTHNTRFFCALFRRYDAEAACAIMWPQILAARVWSGTWPDRLSLGRHNVWYISGQLRKNRFLCIIVGVSRYNIRLYIYAKMSVANIAILYKSEFDTFRIYMSEWKLETDADFS